MELTQYASDDPPSLSIREYEPSDADRVWEVHRRTIEDSPLPFVTNEEFDADLKNVEEHYAETGGRFLVGSVDDTLVATGGLKPLSEESIELRRLRVLPAHQRNGYGTALLHRLEEFAREQAFDRIELHTDDVLTTARRMYETRNYEETHRQPHPLIDGEIVFYEKDL